MNPQIKNILALPVIKVGKAFTEKALGGNDEN